MHLDGGLNNPYPPASRLPNVASAIPEDTPRARVHALLARYEDVRDPMIAALPTTYQAAIESRLRALLTTSLVMEPAR
jgi:hypothetical protein